MKKENQKVKLSEKNRDFDGMCRKHTAYDTFICIFYDLLHNCGGTGSQGACDLVFNL